MKYNILVSTTVDSLIQFDSDEKYNKEQVEQIVRDIMDKDDEAVMEKLKPTVYWSVASGREISYSIDGKIQRDTREKEAK